MNDKSKHLIYEAIFYYLAIIEGIENNVLQIY